MAIIVVLVTALVGPLFIDWTSYRSAFESHAEKLIGRQVKILGDADAFLLPTPSVTFTDVRVGDADNPLMIVSRFSARIELAPLLKGEVRVIDMTLERPDLRLILNEEGRLTAFGEAGRAKDLTAFDPAAVAFEQIDIVDGSVQLSDARSAQVQRLSDVNLSISARALIGPFKADGSLRAGATTQQVKIATGKVRPDGAIRVKLQVNPETMPVELLLDGNLSADDLMPQYAGSFDLKRLLPQPDAEGATAEQATSAAATDGDPWRVTGGFKLADGALSVEEYELTYGPEDRRFNLTGTGTISLGPEPRFDMVAEAKQIDLDRMLARGDDAAGKNAADTLATLFAGLQQAPKPGLDGRVQARIPGVVVAGGAIQELSFEAMTTSTGWHIANLQGRLPGRSRIDLSGEVGLDRSLAFEGDMTLSVEQPAALANWWRGGGSLAGATLDPLQVHGHLTVGKTGVALTEARLRTDLSLGTGSVSWRPARDNVNAAFVLDLNADRFELTQLGAAARLALAGYGTGGGGITDIDLRVRVDTLITEEVEASGVEIVVGFSGDTLRIDRMTLADLAGARIIANGTIKQALTTPDGDLELDVTAEKLDGLANLIIDLFPDSTLARRLTTAGDMLGPAIVSAKLSGRAEDGASAVTLDVGGEVGGSELKVRGEFSGRVDKWREAESDLTLTMEGPDSGRLLSQLGFDVLPLGGMPAGHVALTAKGKPNAGLAVEADVDVAGTTAKLTGTTAFPDRGGMTYDMKISAESADLGPLALLTGRVLPVIAGAVPGKLSATIEGDATLLGFRELVGTVAEVGLSGSGTIDLTSDVPRLSSDLKLDSVDLRFLTELAFGADTWASQASAVIADTSGGENIWPSAPFGAPLLGFISANVAVSTKRLWLTDTLAIEDGGFKLDLTPNGLALDGIHGALFSGTADAALQIKRSDDGEAVLSATLHVADGDLAAIVWKDDETPRATGRFDFGADVNATGRSIAAMLSALAGGGTLTLRNGTIAGVNPGAFQSVIDAVDGGLPLADDPVRAAFDKEFSNGDLDFKQVDAVLSIASGTIRARNMSLDAATARATGSATLDLNDFSFESDWTIGIASEHQNVIGAEPQVVMRFEGALADPTRSVDTAPFMSYLTLRAYEQEVDRVEALQAEILERDRLTRELRRLRQQKARREEEARRERLAEEARRAQEAAREAARRKREENERRLRDAVEGAIEAPPEQQPALTPAPRSSRSQDRRPAIEPLQPSGGLAPLPDAIDIGPPPTPGGQGSLTETVPFAPADPSAGPPATGQPLQLQPAAPPQTVQQQGAAPQPQRRQRIINAPGDRVIIMPEFDPTKQRYIESTGGRLIRVPN